LDNFDGATCKTYGWDDSVDSAAIFICIKQNGNDLLAGKLPSLPFLIKAFKSCPTNSFCVSDTTWQTNITDITKVTITQRRASTVYSRGNMTILDVFDLGTPQPTNYGPEDFFPIFDMAMSNATDNAAGIQYVFWIASQGNTDTQYDAQFLLRQLIAVPVGIFNDPTFWGIYPDANLLTTGNLATPSYRVSFLM